MLVEAGEGVFLVEGELREKEESCVRVKGFGAIKLVFSTKRSACIEKPPELIVVYSKSLSVALSAVILSKISLNDSESFTWLAVWELLLGNSVTVVINVVAISGGGKFSVTDSVGRAMTLYSSSCSCTCLLAINVSCSISVAMFLNSCVIARVSCDGKV